MSRPKTKPWTPFKSTYGPGFTEETFRDMINVLKQVGAEPVALPVAQPLVSANQEANSIRQSLPPREQR